MRTDLAQRQDNLPEVGVSNPLARVLDAFDSKKYFIVTPVCSIDRLPPMTRVAVQVVVIDKSRDTYPIPGCKDVGVGKNALNRIAAAANVSWIPERSGQVDTWDDPHRIKYRAVGHLVDFTGRDRTVFGEKEIDLRGEVGEPDTYGNDTAEIVRQAGQAKYKRDPWKQILHERKHILSFAETKAKLRALREGLAIPQAVPTSDINKPWVVPSLVPDWDTSDPEIRRMLMAQRLEAQGVLYGKGRSDQARVAPALAPVAETDDDVIDAAPDDSDNDEPDWGCGVDFHFQEDDAAKSPLPIPEDILKQCPTTDSKRYEFLLGMNSMYETAIERFGAKAAEAAALKNATGVDWINDSPDDLVSVRRAIIDDLSGRQS